jgi:hypothetical protein
MTMAVLRGLAAELPESLAVVVAEGDIVDVRPMTGRDGYTHGAVDPTPIQHVYDLFEYV